MGVNGKLSKNLKSITKNFFSNHNEAYCLQKQAKNALNEVFCLNLKSQHRFLDRLTVSG